MSQSAQLFEQAMQHHRQGRSGDAESLYRRVVDLDPQHAQAHFLMSVLALERGDEFRAEQCIRTAIELAPTNPAFRCNLGVILRRLNRLDEAAQVLLEALSLNPNLVESNFNLALTLEDKGELEAAIACYERIADLKPDLFANQYRLGRALAKKGELARALGHYQCALVLNSEARQCVEEMAGVLGGLGREHSAALLLHGGDPNLTATVRQQSVELYERARGRRRAGQEDEARAELLRAVTLRPNFLEAIFELGLSFEASGEHESAAMCFEQFADFQPAHFDVQLRLARFLGWSKEYTRALAHYQCAMLLRPDSVEALSELAGLLVLLERPEPALALYERALAIQPDNADLHCDRGRVLFELRRYDQAILHQRKALDLVASSANFASLASSLLDVGLVDEAIHSFRSALELEPENAALHSNIVYSMVFTEASAQSILAEARRWNQRHARTAARERTQHRNETAPDRPLRIGYVSPDFRDHCQSFFTVPLFERRDRERFKYICYSNSDKSDALTDRIRGLADGWRDIRDLSDPEAAKLIEEDGIDILVDLTMHMNAHRLLVFAHKPAPIQVSWLAYPGTTGLAAMDYRLTDPFLDPPDLDESQYSERTLRLPHTFWCYDPLCSDIDVGPLPARAAGHVTFGCLNDLVKTNRSLFAIWARVLRRIEGSRLLMLAPEGQARERIGNVFREGGIDPARLEFASRVPRMRYLELYQRIDVGLDPFPYNGHTTSLDSFWMGVPVTTLVGETIVGRAGLSLASNLSLPELVATTTDEFVERTAALVSDLDRLAEVRRGLRQRMAASPLMDASLFARGLEDLYREMWRELCARHARG
jgi:predicted O-linked N-acetylglucosamine transferase (SPINDLY family)